MNKRAPTEIANCDYHLSRGRRFYARLNAAKDLLERCQECYTDRRRAEFDQCPAMIETVLKRVLLFLECEERIRHVLLLGDDDLLSVALVASGARFRITVVDTDTRLLSNINKWTASPVDVVHHDLRQPLPHHLLW